MQSTLEDLKARRSCRSYLPDQVTAEELNAVLEAGMFAPTGGGKQSPVMVVVQDKETIDLMAGLNAPFSRNPDADPFYGAPTVIVVLGEKRFPTYVYDGSCVMENLLIAADALGLGACWIHRAKEVFETEEGKNLLQKWGLPPEEYEGIGNCTLGYWAVPKQDPKPRKNGYVIRT